MLIATQQIVVHRSYQEEFYYNNPEYILYFMGFALVVIIGAVLFNKFKR